MSFLKARGGKVSPNWILAVACLGIFLAALDQMVVVTALPDIMLDIKVPVTELNRAAWIVIGYLLGYTVAMPLTGRISDVHGHARVYIGSFLLFLVGSVLAAAAPNLNWMVGARIIQAVGGGAGVPVTMAIAGETFASHRRAVAIGIVGAAAEAGGVLGPLYGGVIAQGMGWQWIFWINLPLGAIIVGLVYFVVPRGRRLNAKVDYRGGVILGMALTLLVLALSQSLGSWSSPYTIGMLSASALCIALFIRRELVGTEPMVDLSMFKSGTFSAANVAHFMVGGALIMAIVTIPLMSDTIMGQGALEGGLRLVRLTAMIPVGAVLGGFLCQRMGYRVPMVLGLLLAASGFYLLSQWPLDIADPRMTRDLLIGGLGFGLIIAPVGTAVINSVKEGQKATAASLVTLMRMMGMMVGLAALTSWGMGRYDVLVGRIPDINQLPDATLNLFHDFFWVALVVCLAALVPVLWMRYSPKGFSSSEGHEAGHDGGADQRNSQVIVDRKRNEFDD